MGRALVAAVVVLVACSAPAPVTTGPSATASPSAVATASFQPAPSRTAVPPIRTTAAGPISYPVRIIELGRGSSTTIRVWLVDLTGRRAPVVAAQWEGGSLFRDVSASGDGRTLAITARGTGASALYVLHTETGKLDVAFDDPQLLAVEPRISTDGSRIAYSRLRLAGSNADDLGIWMYDTTNASTRRLVDPPATAGIASQSLGWSVDRKWLAIQSTARPTVRLVPADGGAAVPVTDGDMVSWRSQAPELLVGATLNGGQTVRISTFDVTTKTVREVHQVQQSILRDMQWHPTQDHFLFGQDEPAVFTRSPSYDVWRRNADGTGATLIEKSTRGVTSPEWSADGSLLTEWQADSATTIEIWEVPSRRQITRICRGAGTPPASCAPGP